LASFAQRKLGLDRKTVARLMAAFGHHDMSRRSVAKSLLALRALEAHPDYRRMSAVVSKRAVALGGMQARFQKLLALRRKKLALQGGAEDVRRMADVFGNSLQILVQPLSAIARIREMYLRPDSS
ncbi:MAG: hypothetical protein AABW54_04865, partial [Candidatus Micrarchaeota archaeon]